MGETEQIDHVIFIKTSMKLYKSYEEAFENLYKNELASVVAEW